MLFKHWSYNLILVVLTITSCEYLRKDIPDEASLFEQKLKEINWQEPSMYPLLSVCDSLQDKLDIKNCLMQTVKDSLQKKLDEQIIFKIEKSDSINVSININHKGEWGVQCPDTLEYAASLNTLFLNALQNLNIEQPAQTNGIPVNCQWIVPLIIKFN